MTALNEYQRLESSGLWRASPEAQRRDVIVSFGDATIVLTDKNERALAHWSLPAIRRLNPGQMPALFSPDDEAVETLELEDEVMIAAIEKIGDAIERARPHPGRLRGLLLGGGALLILALLVFWLPGALVRYTVSIVPEAKRVEIGDAILSDLARISGQPCRAPLSRPALSALQARLARPDGGRLRLVVLPSGVTGADHLPGGIVLLGRTLVEDYEEPDVVAGYILAEELRAEETDPLGRLLDHAGLRAAFRLLTTGSLKPETLSNYAEALVTSPKAPLDDAPLLARFERAELRSSPYAYALDHSGETTLGLIEADPYPTGAPRPVLSDGQWVALQGICGE